MAPGKHRRFSHAANWREPALLVKELLQNSLDASPSRIDFTIAYEAIDECVRVVCDDVGEGVNDFDKMRCVFFTSKTDSNLKRGRMGRGFKEILVVAQNARVESKGRVIEFTRDADGTTGVATRKGTREVGTRVSCRCLGVRKAPRILFPIFSVF